MKNIYELSTDEKDKYRKEFNKLRFTKDVHLVMKPAMLLSFLLLLTSVVLSGLVEENLNLQVYEKLANDLGIVLLLLFVVLSIYLNITFMRWMKLKHDVEY